MTISYKWLCEYLPVPLDPERLSRILTSIGLEVESMHHFEEVKGGLKGLVIGEVLTAEKHPNADKLTITTVDTGNGHPLQIVCGAPNVAAGQKVIVAPVGSTIHPSSGDPLTMKVAKIRSVESHGMICAEDEIGLGTSHAGIMVLPADAKPGLGAPEYFQPYTDIVYEIGLTPNRMDAMSHWGVARDVCAYLSHHDKKEIKPKIPNANGFKPDNTSLQIKVRIDNAAACPRYSGLTISGITVGDSPKWLQQRLKAIGLRPINNIVDITNYIQHETGQPLHAFDASRISNGEIIVKNLPEGTPFITLDEKERKLSSEDLMICDDKGGLCIAGVFGGIESGVGNATKNIFLESAFFDGITLRKTSFRHGLRTDAASRFEKGTDISATVNVLKRAAIMIKEIAGGQISSEITDIYPDPRSKTEVAIKYHFLKKLSGKNYHPDAIKNILSSLGFETLKEGIDELRVAVPFHKPDVALPADLVEEILRIDGLDNVAIPEAIMITPAIEENTVKNAYYEKIAGYLTGSGFNEMMTNSITNASYYSEDEQTYMVKMLNSLSAELNILRNSLFETSLEVVAHNINHRNTNLRLFEFGKAYSRDAEGKFIETEQLCIVLSGNVSDPTWKQKAIPADIYRLKGILEALFRIAGVLPDSVDQLDVPKLDNHLVYRAGNEILAGAGEVNKSVLQRFGIKAPVFYAGINWSVLSELVKKQNRKVTEVSKFPAVQRDLAMIVPSRLQYAELEATLKRLQLKNLRDVKLFDIFESEKLGAGKKSMAVNFTFLDDEKTLTDKEIETWMKKIMSALEKEVSAEIRKN